MGKELPKINWKGKTYTFDYRLNELRTIGKKGIEFIALNNMETELLNFAIHSRDPSLVKANMRDLDWKLKEVV
jgi:hypothetical protein